MVAVDPRFLGYGPLNPDVIGASRWVQVNEMPDAFILTFVAGSGDCPAGCINHDYVKFRVGRDGSVKKLCEWAEGEVPRGSPC